MDAGKKIKNIVFVVVVANLALVAYVLLGVLSPKSAPTPGSDAAEKVARLTNAEPVLIQPQKPGNSVTGTNTVTNTPSAR